MTHEFTVNGRLAVILTPDDGLEGMILKQMAEAAEKGQTITLASAGDGMGTIVVSVAR